MYYLSVGGPPVKRGLGNLLGERQRDGPQLVSSWSARSEARTNELDTGEDPALSVTPKHVPDGSAMAWRSPFGVRGIFAAAFPACRRRAPRLISVRGDGVAPVT